MQRGAIAFFRHDPQVDLQAALEEDTGTRWTHYKYFGNLIIGGKILHHVATGRGGYDDIEVAHCFAHAPETSGDCYLFYAGHSPKIRS